MKVGDTVRILSGNLFDSFLTKDSGVELFEGSTGVIVEIDSFGSFDVCLSAEDDKRLGIGYSIWPFNKDELEVIEDDGSSVATDD